MLRIIKYEVDDVEHLPRYKQKLIANSLGGLFEVQCDPWKLYVLEPYKRNQNYCVMETKTLEGYTKQVLKKRREDKSFMRTVEFLRETDILTYNIKANTNYRFITRLIKDFTDFYGLPDITDTPLGNNARMGQRRKREEQQAEVPAAVVPAAAVPTHDDSK